MDKKDLNIHYSNLEMDALSLDNRPNRGGDMFSETPLNEKQNEVNEVCTALELDGASEGVVSDSSSISSQSSDTFDLGMNEETAKDLLSKMSQTERQKLYFLHMQSVKVDKSLKRNKYAEIKNSCAETFVLRNKKTGKIVELKAKSAIHACTLAGWNPKKVVILNKK